MRDYDRKKQKIDNKVLEAIICEDTGWTYEEYLSNPKPFLELMKEKKRIDIKNKSKEYEELNNRINKAK